MTKLREAAELALVSLTIPIHVQPFGMRANAIAALRAALAEPNEEAALRARIEELEYELKEVRNELR